MLKKYLWGAIVPVLAVSVLVGAIPNKSIADSLSPAVHASYNTYFGRITGTVIDVDNKEPLCSAVISLLDSTISTSTDLDGRYDLSKVPVGIYTVQAKMVGYEAQTITGVKAIMDLKTPVNFRLRPIGINRLKKQNIYLYPYLYPTKKETLTVQLHPMGNIVKSLPKYLTGEAEYIGTRPDMKTVSKNDIKMAMATEKERNITTGNNKGWNIIVAPGGRINGTYDRLFYEAEAFFNFTLDAGWVLQRSNFARRMNEILVNIGLNDKERADFMAYWSKRIDWKKKYCIAYYLKRNEIDKAAPLTISKTPESLMRLFFKFVPTDTLVTVPEPKIEKFQRIGFSVVEWGGILD